MELRMSNLRWGYVDLIHVVREGGKPVDVRGQATRELTGITLRFPDATADMLPVGTGRKVNTRLAAVEALQLIGGADAYNLIVRAAPEYGRVLVDAQDPAYGAYGPRVLPQLPHVVHQLRHDPTTRQAVMTIWKVDDLTHRGDKPCTLTLQFLIRDGQLELHTNMRSQDVWLGVPYDVFMFTQLQRTVATTLGVRAGAYVHHVTSLHLYEHDLDRSFTLYPPHESNYLTDLPPGIVGMREIVPLMAEVRLLLRDEWNVTDDDWLRLNPWYADRIQELHRTEIVA